MNVQQNSQAPSKETIEEFKNDTKQLKELKIKRNIRQLQNKAVFFEGQLNPLAGENKQLKKQLIQLRKSVIVSTEILRALLPVENDPNRKLKIQMAGVEEIAGMIEQGWKALEQSIRQLEKSAQQDQEAIRKQQQLLRITTESYEQAIQRLNSQREKMKTQMSQKIDSLEQKIVKQQQQSQKQKQRLIQEHQRILQTAKIVQRQLRINLRDIIEKYQHCETANQRLRDELTNHLQQFERSKKNIKQIYQNLMKEKLEEQKQSYEFLLKIKDEQNLELRNDLTIQAEEFQQRIADKNQSIEKLSEKIGQYKRDIARKDEELYAEKVKVEDSRKAINKLEGDLAESQRQAEKVHKKLIHEIQVMKDREGQAQSLFEQQKQKLEAIIKQSKLQINSLQKEKNMLNSILQKNDKSSAELKKQIIAQAEEFERLIQLEKQKANQTKQSFLQSQKMLNELIEKSKNQLQMKKQQLKETILKNQKQVGELKQIHETMLKNINDANKRTINLMRTDHSEKLKQLNHEFQIQMKEKDMVNNEYVKKLINEKSMQMMKYEDSLKQANQMSESLKRDLSEKAAELRQMQVKLEQEFISNAQKLMQERVKHKAFLEQQMEQFKKSAQERQRYFESALSSKQREMQEMKESLDRKIEDMQKSMQQEINMLKKTHGVEEIENKYQMMIKRMKEESQIELLRKQEELNQQRNELEKECQRKINELSQTFNEELTNLSNQMQFDISKLNEQLLEEQQAHQFSKLTRQQKIVVLLQKLNKFKEDMTEKDVKIIDLEIDIERKNKQIQQIDIIVEQRIAEERKQFEQKLSEFSQQCQNRINQEIIKCQAEVQKIENDRIKHSMDLNEQFMIMRDQHKREIERLNSKYVELERIFEERPSRIEDLTKIRELIKDKSKMDQEINRCKNKVNEANQIVKYLNLELQNYQDTYDIFGPGREKLSPDRRQAEQHNISNLDSSMSLLQERIMEPKSGYELSHKKSNPLSRRFITDSVEKICIFPNIDRKSSQILESPDEEQQCDRDQSKNHASIKDIKKEDKSEELRSNANLFVSLIGNPRNSIIESPKKLEYKRKLQKFKRKKDRKYKAGQTLDM